MIHRIVLSCLSVLLLGVRALDARAQEVRAVIIPTDTIRVGDVFGVVLQVDLPSGTTLILPDSLMLGADFENAARKQVRVDSLANGELRYLITYPVTAWRTGTLPLPQITATFSRQGLPQSIQVPLPDVEVVTVLPVDTAGVEPKPPRDVWGASRVWWPWLLAGVLLLAALIALYLWWRKRRKQPVEEPLAPMIPVIMPREWILRELQRIEKSGVIERGELRQFYIDLSEPLRRYVAQLDSSWSTDLTTTELTRAFTRSSADGRGLIVLLERADLVKFARHDAGAHQARGDLAAARQWVETFEKPLPLAEAA